MVFQLKVKCYSGYRGEQTPRSFCFGTREIGVKEVIDQWLSPDYRYFKVLAEDGGTYILRHDVVSRNWELTCFKSKGGLPVDIISQQDGSAGSLS